MNWVDFIYKWQDLTGAALGPFLAIILSAIGFLIKERWEEKRARKEAHRRIEIAVSQSLNDSFVLREQLKWMAARIKELVAEARSITEPNIFFMNRVNFSVMREIYRDTDLSRFKVQSYYIHNKLLFIDAGIKETNEVVALFRKDFEMLIQQNAMLIAAMKENPNPPIQRQTYADNLEAFAKVIENFAQKTVNDGIKILAQIKVYNNMVREKYGYWIWWKHESTRLKYFRTKLEQKEYARNLDSLDKIDTVIEEKVQKAIEKAEKRGEKLFAQNEEK